MRYFYTFIIMFCFWMLLSGKFDSFHLGLGVISSLLVSMLSADLLFEDTSRNGRLKEAWRFARYTGWLLYQIVLANLYVAFLALHPRMKEMLDPTIVTFKSKLKSTLSLVTLANSITLTPGTITIRMEDDVFYVHSLNRKTAEGLPGEMEARIARVFGED